VTEIVVPQKAETRASGALVWHLDVLEGAYPPMLALSIQKGMSDGGSDASIPKLPPILKTLDWDGRSPELDDLSIKMEWKILSYSESIRRFWQKILWRWGSEARTYAITNACK